MGEANVPAQQPQEIEEARFSPSHVDSRRPGNPESAAPEGPPPAVCLIWSIRDRTTFSTLRSARRVRSGPLTVSFVQGNPSEPPRIAYAIGSKVGGAVVRNRLRRRLRSVVRSLGSQLCPGAYLIGAAPEAVGFSVEELRATVSYLLHRVGNARFQRASDSAASS
jgi:ribonuclease P protein component